MRIKKADSILAILVIIGCSFITTASCEENKEARRSFEIEKLNKNIELFTPSLYTLKAGEELVTISSGDEKNSYITDKIGKKDRDWILISEKSYNNIGNPLILTFDIVKVQVVSTKETKTFNFVYSKTFNPIDSVKK